MDNIEVFKDTQNRIKNDSRLNELTEKAVDRTYFIKEGFCSDKKPCFSDSKIFFEESLTLISAFRLVDSGKKTAVLNFANPVNPGGGVLQGSRAQEEYLCRASNLYNCLISSNARPYYDYHKKLRGMNSVNNMFLGTDMIVYSPDVTFFKKDDGFVPDSDCSPTQEYTDNWRTLDVITCAAPYFVNSKDAIPEGDLYHLMCKRICNILEAAISNGVSAIVLGAFGCGAFNNPPTIIAKAFRDVFLEERYLHAFSDVVFAIKRTGAFCENIEAFDVAFQRFPSDEYVFSEERNKRRFF